MQRNNYNLKWQVTEINTGRCKRTDKEEWLGYSWCWSIGKTPRGSQVWTQSLRQSMSYIKVREEACWNESHSRKWDHKKRHGSLQQHHKNFDDAQSLRPEMEKGEVTERRSRRVLWTMQEEDIYLVLSVSNRESLKGLNQRNMLGFLICWQHEWYTEGDGTGRALAGWEHREVVWFCRPDEDSWGSIRRAREGVVFKSIWERSQ